MTESTPPPLAQFADRLRHGAAESLTDETVSQLYAHYRLLLRWNERTSLVGPGTLCRAVELHYAEALAALPHIPRSSAGTLVDVGSGAGFPGFVLAAARPRLRVVLVESRARKWAFLRAAVLESGISVDCVHGRVDRSLPAPFPPRVDWLTLRALKLPRRAWTALTARLAENGRVLVWAGREDPEIPDGILRKKSTTPLPGTEWRRIVELERS